MVRCVRADRERQPMAIHNRHDFHAFSALRWSDFRPATFGHNERRIDEAFFFIQRAFVAKLLGNVGQYQTQKSRGSTKFESVDAQFCSSDSFAAACAIVAPDEVIQGTVKYRRKDWHYW